MTGPALAYAAEVAHNSSESAHDPWCEILEERIPMVNEPLTTTQVWLQLGIPVERRSGACKRRLNKVMCELGYKPTKMPGVSGQATLWVK